VEGLVGGDEEGGSATGEASGKFAVSRSCADY
jgi:hypothetical protein